MSGNTRSALVVLALLGGALALGVQEARRGQFLAPGAQAPAFLFETLGGGTVALRELKGQVVLLDFWATWCPPCREEMPDLVTVAQEYAPRGVRLIAASVDDPEDAKARVGLFARNQAPGLAPFAAFATPASVRAYQVQAYPTLYVLDREGRVLSARSGQLSARKLRRLLEEALEAK